jgi:hypothetical protein
MSSVFQLYASEIAKTRRFSAGVRIFIQTAAQELCYEGNNLRM